MGVPQDRTRDRTHQQIGPGAGQGVSTQWSGYTTGGTPLAVTQEDLLHKFCFFIMWSCSTNKRTQRSWEMAICNTYFKSCGRSGTSGPLLLSNAVYVADDDVKSWCNIQHSIYWWWQWLTYSVSLCHKIRVVLEKISERKGISKMTFNIGTEVINGKMDFGKSGFAKLSECEQLPTMCSSFRFSAFCHPEKTLFVRFAIHFINLNYNFLGSQLNFIEICFFYIYS